MEPRVLDPSLDAPAFDREGRRWPGPKAQPRALALHSRGGVNAGRALRSLRPLVAGSRGCSVTFSSRPFRPFSLFSSKILAARQAQLRCGTSSDDGDDNEGKRIKRDCGQSGRRRNKERRQADAGRRGRKVEAKREASVAALPPKASTMRPSSEPEKEANARAVKVTRGRTSRRTRASSPARTSRTPAASRRSARAFEHGQRAHLI